MEAKYEEMGDGSRLLRFSSWIGRIYDYEPVALTVMVTLTGSLSSPGGGAWLVGVRVALIGEEVRGEDARGKAMAGPAKHQSSVDKTDVHYDF